FQDLRETEAFFGWMQTVERKLRDNGRITASQLPQALLDSATAGTLIQGALYYAGFDELTPADRRLFAACDAHAWSVEPTFPAAPQYRVGLQTTAEELIHAAAWARRKLEDNPDARIGIVVRGLAGLSVPADRIFDDALHPGLDFAHPAASSVAFHISAGVPSAEVPLIAVALLALGIKSGLRIGEAGMLLR